MKKLFLLVIVSWQLSGFMPNNGWIGSKEASNHVTNYPLISGDNFRAIADHIYDETNLYTFDPQLVKPGEIVFLNTVFIFHFARVIHQQIASPYILLSHNSDIAVPDYHVDMLEDPKLIAWFSPNIMIPNHPKLHVIPLGVNNGCYNRTQPLSDAIELRRAARPLKAYLNFQPGNNPVLRNYVWRLLCDKSFCVVAQDRSYEQYLSDMKGCTFVISPAGFGIDCYRHWEALLVGCIPIMKHSTIDKVFDDLPVILVHDWSIVTEQLIMLEYEKMRYKRFNYKKLLINYWIDEIRAVQKQYRSSHM